MTKEILDIVCKALNINEQTAMQNHKHIDEIDAEYYWNPIRGGLSIIINSKGEKLCATSSVNFDRHYEEFKNGRRN